MRQAGILAAAGLHALDHHVARLAEDHARAGRLADALRALDAVTAAQQHSNMVFVDVAPDLLPRLREAMDARRVRLSIGDSPRLRLVMHLDVDDAGVSRVVDGFAALA